MFQIANKEVSILVVLSVDVVLGEEVAPHVPDEVVGYQRDVHPTISGPQYCEHLKKKIDHQFWPILTTNFDKWPDKSTTSYAMLDVEGEIEIFVREESSNCTLYCKSKTHFCNI